MVTVRAPTIKLSSQLLIILVERHGLMAHRHELEQDCPAQIKANNQGRSRSRESSYNQTIFSAADHFGKETRFDGTLS